MQVLEKVLKATEAKARTKARAEAGLKLKSRASKPSSSSEKD
jgi:hypothetical protein